MSMSKHQYLLGKIAEEAAELAQRALKAQQYGVGEIQSGQPFTNLQRMKHELLDVLVWVGKLDDLTGDEPLGYDDVLHHAKLTHHGQEEMLELSRKCGMTRR